MENINMDDSALQDERREKRRQRRIKSQITAYIVAAALFFVIIGAGFFVVRGVGGALIRMSAEAEESMEEASVETEPTAVESPDESVTDVAVLDTPDVLDEIVDTCMADMTLEDKVAGLFFVAPEQLTGTDVAVKAGTATQDALAAYPVGGMCYFSKNIKDEAQITDMISSTKSMSKYPIFIATTEVGGSSSQVSSALSLPVPATPSEIGSSGDAKKAFDSAAGVSDYLNKYGFDLNIGVNANLSDSEAAFGTDPELVSEMVAQTISGLRTYGVKSCLQYFPNMSDKGETIDDMADELIPFSRGVDAGADMIMVCTAPSSGVTGDDTPSCLSSQVIQGVLRERLGYKGIIITDSLTDGNVTEKYSSADAAVAAIQAGADMIFMPENFTESYEGILAAVQSGIITEDRINESIHRIYRVKYADKAAEISE